MGQVKRRAHVLSDDCGGICVGFCGGAGRIFTPDRLKGVCSDSVAFELGV